LTVPFLGVAILAAPWFSACDDPVPAIGTSLGQSGELQILYKPCSSTRTVRSVELEDSDGGTLWKIVATRESRERTFVAGDVPPGFEAETSLNEDLRGKRLRASVSGVGPEFFAFDDLVISKVFVVGEGNMNPEDFWARDTCG
jgi:hypothetical protein